MSDLQWTPEVGQHVKRKADPSTVYKITHIAANGEISGTEYRPDITPGITTHHQPKEFSMEPPAEFEPSTNGHATEIENPGMTARKFNDQLNATLGEIKSLRQEVNESRQALAELKQLYDQAIIDRDIAIRKNESLQKKIDKLKAEQGRAAFEQIRHLERENKELRQQLENRSKRTSNTLTFKTLVQRNLRSDDEINRADREITEWKSNGWNVTHQAVDITPDTFNRALAMERHQYTMEMEPSENSIFAGYDRNAWDLEVIKAGQERYDTIVQPAAGSANKEAKPA